MKLRTLSVCYLVLLSAHVAGQTEYAIERFQISGGGGVSSGGRFAIRGGAGRADSSGEAEEGIYTITGGYWSALAAVEPALPALTVATDDGGTMTIRWPSPSPGWFLQRTSSLAVDGWELAPESVSDNGSFKFITVQTPISGLRFYRLAK